MPMLKMLLKSILLLGATLVLAGCLGQAKMKVLVTENPGISATAIKARSIVVARPAGEAVRNADAASQQLVLINALKQHGLRVVAADAAGPDAAILRFRHKISDAKTVQKSVRVPITQTMHVPTRQGNRTVMMLQTRTVGYDTKLVEELQYTSSLDVSITELGSALADTLYTGRAIVKGTCGKLSALVVPLANGLLQGFPGNPGSTAYKDVPAAEC